MNTKFLYVGIFLSFEALYCSQEALDLYLKEDIKHECAFNTLKKSDSSQQLRRLKEAIHNWNVGTAAFSKSKNSSLHMPHHNESKK